MASQNEIFERIAAYIANSQGPFSQHGIELEGNLYQQRLLRGKKRVFSSKPLTVLSDQSFEEISYQLEEYKRSPLALRPSMGTIEARIFNGTFDMREIANNELFMQRLLKELLEEGSELGKIIDITSPHLKLSDLMAGIKEWEEFKSIEPHEL